jgi:putative phosphoribosyl transferase
MPFLDRKEAGLKLANLLRRFAGRGALVLGLPRGGVPVAYEVAVALGAPLDVWVVRKVGAPIQPELGVGAVAEGGGLFLDPTIIAEVGASRAEIERIVDEQTSEVKRRIRLFRGGRPPPVIRNRTVILVDDGIATGGTVRAAVDAIRKLRPFRLVLAVPVAAKQALEALQNEVDEIVCVDPTDELWAIGAWYYDFRQVSDEEVVALLEKARSREVSAESPSA